MSKHKQSAQAVDKENTPILTSKVKIEFPGHSSTIAFIAVYGPPGMSKSELNEIQSKLDSVAYTIWNFADRTLFPEFCPKE
jgi:hypothetical protein